MAAESQHHCMLAKPSTSSLTSICSNLAALTNLHNHINTLIQKPLVQNALSHEQLDRNPTDELLDRSLMLVDLCNFSRDVACLTKESIRELESSIRRKACGVNAYVASRKEIRKTANKCIKDLKSFDRNSTALRRKDRDGIKTVGSMLMEMEALDFSVLKSVLIVLSGAQGGWKQAIWSLFSKFAQMGCVDCGTEQLNVLVPRKGVENIDLKQLKATEIWMEEVEEGLEGLFRSMIKTRVSLLNAFNH